MKHSKPFALSVVAAVSTLGLAACAGSASQGTASQGSGDANTVTFRSWSPIEQTTAAMVTAFEDANQGKKIDATIFNYPEYIVDLQTRASSGTMPDLVGLQPGALTQQYRSNLMPLNDCAEKTWGSDWESRFYPVGLEQARAGNPEGDENYYALPVLTQTVNLWANTEIFTKAGASVPRTWDELKATVDKLAASDSQAVPFLLPAKDGWLRNAVFMQIANNISPGIVQQAESGTVAWTDPKIVEAFGYWGKLFSDGIAQQGAIGLDAYPTGVNQFEAGKAGMIPLGAWWIQQSDPTKDQSQIPPLSVGMSGYEPFLFPTIPGGAPESQLVGGIDLAMGISKNSANPDLACQVVTDWIAGSGAQKLVDTMNDVPAVKGLAPSKFTSEKQKQIWNTLADEWLPEVKYSRYFNDPKIDQAVADALAAVATSSKSPQEAAAAVQTVQDSLS